MRTQTSINEPPRSQTLVLPTNHQQRKPTELVLFDEGDEIEMSPSQHQGSKPASSVNLAQSTRNR